MCRGNIKQRHSKKVVKCKPRRSPEEISSANILVLKSYPPELWEKIFLLFKPLGLILLWHPSKLTRVLFTLSHVFPFLLPDWIMSSFLSSSSLTLFCLLKQAVYLVQWIFHFSYYTFQVQNFWFLFIISLFILCCSYNVLLISFPCLSLALSICKTNYISLCPVSPISGPSLG